MTTTATKRKQEMFWNDVLAERDRLRTEAVQLRKVLRRSDETFQWLLDCARSGRAPAIEALLAMDAPHMVRAALAKEKTKG